MNHVFTSTTLLGMNTNPEKITKKHLKISVLAINYAEKQNPMILWKQKLSMRRLLQFLIKNSAVKLLLMLAPSLQFLSLDYQGLDQRL